MGGHTLVGKIFNAILDPIDDLLDSIFGSTEIMVDAQITNLLTPGEANRRAKRQSIRNSHGSLSSYSSQYRAFQRNYRQKFSAKFLSNLGYLPSSTATTRLLDPIAVKSYISTHDPAIVNVSQTFIKYMSEEEAAWDWMEDNIGWSNANKVAINNGKTWSNLIITNDDTNIVMNFTRDPIETILDNLTSNFSYDSVNSTVTLLTGPNTYNVIGTTGSGTTDIRIAIDGVDFYTASIAELTDYTTTTPLKEPGSYTISVYETANSVETLTSETVIDIVATPEVYDVQALDTTDLGGFYRTTVILQSDNITSVTIDTSIEVTSWSIPSTTIANEKMMVVYDRGGAEWYYYTEDLATIPSTLYTLASIDITAIIPLKEDNVIFNENRKMERMLEKLNITRSSLLPTLNNSSIDSAYLMTGVYPNTQDQAGIKAVFNMFDLITNGSGDISIAMSKLNMVYAFTINKSVVNAKVLPVNTYSNSTVNNVKTLIYQATETQYKKIVISNYSQTYTISGRTIIATFNDAKDISRMVLPLSVLNGLVYKDFVSVYEDSLSLLAYSVEVVEISWEESAAFSIILKIAAVVIAVVSIGQAIQVSYALWTAGAYVSLAIYVASTVAIGIALSYGVTVAMDFLVNTLGLDPAIAALVAIAATYSGTKFANISFGKEQWLLLANKLIDETNDIVIDQIAEINADNEEYIKEMQEKNEHIMELLQAFDTGVVGMFNMNLTKEYSPYQIAEVFVDSKVNITELDILLDVDSAIHSRLELE